jgi:predicted ester cyclase
MHEDFMGVAASGQKIVLPGISIFHFRNGLCFERWAYSDSMVLLSQLRGAVTAQAQ